MSLVAAMRAMERARARRQGKLRAMIICDLPLPIACRERTWLQFVQLGMERNLSQISGNLACSLRTHRGRQILRWLHDFKIHDDSMPVIANRPWRWPLSLEYEAGGPLVDLARPR
jgi:hypothetical protein